MQLAQMPHLALEPGGEDDGVEVVRAAVGERHPRGMIDGGGTSKKRKKS